MLRLTSGFDATSPFSCPDDRKGLQQLDGHMHFFEQTFELCELNLNQIIFVIFLIDVLGKVKFVQSGKTKPTPPLLRIVSYTCTIMLFPSLKKLGIVSV